MKELLNIAEVLELPLGTRTIIVDDETCEIIVVEPTFDCDGEINGKCLMCEDCGECLVITTYTLNAKYKIVK